ncbi:Nuclear pore complex-interacting protein family member B13, partial [Dissostichus eleginoides]
PTASTTGCHFQTNKSRRLAPDWLDDSIMAAAESKQLCMWRAGGGNKHVLRQTEICRRRCADGDVQTEMCRRRCADGDVQTEMCRRRCADGDAQTEMRRRRWADGDVQTEMCRRRFADGHVQTEMCRRRCADGDVQMEMGRRDGDVQPEMCRRRYADGDVQTEMCRRRCADGDVQTDMCRRRCADGDVLCREKQLQIGIRGQDRTRQGNRGVPGDLGKKGDRGDLGEPGANGLTVTSRSTFPRLNNTLEPFHLHAPPSLVGEEAHEVNPGIKVGASLTLKSLKRLPAL